MMVMIEIIRFRNESIHRTNTEFMKNISR